MLAAPGPSFALEATQGNFDRLVVESSRKGPVLVGFWASRAGPSLRYRQRRFRH
jgi:thioredoxin-like negative regulator of GroEL